MTSNSGDGSGLVQRNVQPLTPNEESPATGRDQLGRFAPGPGNRWAMKTGVRSRYVAAGLMPEQAEARAALRERVAAIVGDLGGLDALSALAVGQVQRHARLELVDEFLWTNLQTRGPLTGKGRARAALTAWLAVVDRLQKSAITLGLERRARPVPTPAEYAALHDQRKREAEAAAEGGKADAP